MQNFNSFLSLFFDSKFFSIIIVVLIMILLMVLSYLIKTQKNKIKELEKLNNEKEKAAEEASIMDNKIIPEPETIKKEENSSILNIDSLDNTQANIVLDLKAEKDDHNLVNPIEEYENDEESNAVISTKELEAIEKERDEVYGKENNAKLIEEYEENQEKKAIISYNELLKNASSLELDYIEKPKEEENAPLVKQVEIKEQPLKGVTYAAEEEYLRLLKEFRSNLVANG